MKKATGTGYAERGRTIAPALEFHGASLSTSLTPVRWDTLDPVTFQSLRTATEASLWRLDR